MNTSGTGYAVGVLVATLEGNVTGNVTGNASGTAATVTGAAQSAITSLGTLTTLTVDNVIINGTTIGHTSDTDLLTLASGEITVAGQIGVNVTPARALHIYDGTASVVGSFASANSSGARLRIWQSSESESASLELGKSVAEGFIIVPAADPLTFSHGSTERMRITPTGYLNVGGHTTDYSIIDAVKDSTTTWSTTGYSNPYNYQPLPHELAIRNTTDNTTNSFAGIYFQAGETSSGSQVNSARIAAIRTAAFLTDLAFATRGASGAFACLLYTSPSPRDGLLSRMPSSA